MRFNLHVPELTTNGKVKLSIKGNTPSDEYQTLSTVSPWRAMWRRDRAKAGPRQSRAGLGLSKDASGGRFAAVFSTGAIEQISAEMTRNRRLELITYRKSIYFGQLTIFEPSEKAYLKTPAVSQTVNPSLSQVTMRIISFCRSWQIRQFLPVMPVLRLLANSYVLEEAVRPAPLPSRRQDKNA